MKKIDNNKHCCAPRVRDLWLEQFKAQIDPKHFNQKFERSILRILDEHRKGKNQGIYNDVHEVFGRSNLAHLNEQAREEDRYDPTRMNEVATAYMGYHVIIEILRKRFDNDDSHLKIFDSEPFFTLIVRDLLTVESSRVIKEDPVTAALKIAFDPTKIQDKLGCKERWRAALGIEYLRLRMKSKVTSDLAKWCHQAFPAEAVRCGLPNEDIKNEFENGGWFKLITDLEDVGLDVIDSSDLCDMAELKDKIVNTEGLVDDDHVFYFESHKEMGEYYVLYESEKGKYFQKELRESVLCYCGRVSCGTDTLKEIEDNEKLAAILDTGISPIEIFEIQLEQGALAA